MFNYFPIVYTAASAVTSFNSWHEHSKILCINKKVFSLSIKEYNKAKCSPFARTKQNVPLWHKHREMPSFSTGEALCCS